MGTLLALLAGKGTLAAVVGGLGGTSIVGVVLSFFGFFRKGSVLSKLVLGLCAVLAIAALVLGLVAWHAHAKAKFGDARFSAGVQTERTAWELEKARIAAEIQVKREADQAKMQRLAVDLLTARQTMKEQRDDADRSLQELEDADAAAAASAGTPRNMFDNRVVRELNRAHRSGS